jgi:hypothetical protein
MAQGIKTGGRQKGTPNKLTAEIKERLAAIISEATDNLKLEDCSSAEKIRLIEVGLKYLLPTMKQVDNIHNDALQRFEVEVIGGQGENVFKRIVENIRFENDAGEI